MIIKSNNLNSKKKKDIFLYFFKLFNFNPFEYGMILVNGEALIQLSLGIISQRYDFFVEENFDCEKIIFNNILQMLSLKKIKNKTIIKFQRKKKIFHIFIHEKKKEDLEFYFDGLTANIPENIISHKKITSWNMFVCCLNYGISIKVEKLINYGNLFSGCQNMFTTIMENYSRRNTDNIKYSETYETKNFIEDFEKSSLFDFSKIFSVIVTKNLATDHRYHYFLLENKIIPMTLYKTRFNQYKIISTKVNNQKAISLIDTLISKDISASVAAKNINTHSFQESNNNIFLENNFLDDYFEYDYGMNEVIVKKIDDTLVKISFHSLRLRTMIAKKYFSELFLRVLIESKDYYNFLIVMKSFTDDEYLLCWSILSRLANVDKFIMILLITKKNLCKNFIYGGDSTTLIEEIHNNNFSDEEFISRSTISQKWKLINYGLRKKKIIDEKCLAKIIYLVCKYGGLKIFNCMKNEIGENNILRIIKEKNISKCFYYLNKNISKENYPWIHVGKFMNYDIDHKNAFSSLDK